MSFDREAARSFLSRDVMDFSIRLGLVVIIIVACERVFLPFLPLMTWGLILAVALQPLLAGFMERTGLSAGRGATVLVLLGLGIIGVPTVLLGVSFATHIFDVIGEFNAGAIEIPSPQPSVQEWPLIGEQLYEAWAAAAADPDAFVESLQPQLANFSKAALASAASTAGTLFFFLGALIIAGIMMAYGASGSAMMERVFTRVTTPQKGPALHRLATLTVRSVAVGVVGVAFIQALLLGIGFLLAGIPAAGLLALVVLVIGILQLPALLVSLPSIAYIWAMGDGGTIANVLLTVYFIVAGFADNVLKPLLLGRGVDVPMPIVLIGAIGGMVGSGIIGLFIGAVVLSVAYELFMDWLEQSHVEADDTVQTDEAVGSTD